MIEIKKREVAEVAAGAPFFSSLFWEIRKGEERVGSLFGALQGVQNMVHVQHSTV